MLQNSSEELRVLEQLECLHVWPAQNRLLGAALFLHALPLAETVPRAHARVTFPAAAACSFTFKVGFLLLLLLLLLPAVAAGATAAVPVMPAPSVDASPQ